MYLNYKFNQKLEMVKLMLDRAFYMKMYNKFPVEVISGELFANDESIMREFSKYNKYDIVVLSKLLHNDSTLFLEIAKSNNNNNSDNITLIKAWKSNATELANKLNEMDERRWSNIRGETLLHDYQDSVISSFGEGLVGFDNMKNNAIKVGLFIS